MESKASFAALRHTSLHKKTKPYRTWFYLFRSACGLAFDHQVEPEGLAYTDYLLTREWNQKPASLRSGILRCIKKPSLIGLGFFISLSLRPGF
jgi:hypothetical protein